MSCEKGRMIYFGPGAKITSPQLLVFVCFPKGLPCGQCNQAYAYDLHRFLENLERENEIAQVHTFILNYMLSCLLSPTDILTSMGLRTTPPDGIWQVIILSPSCWICYDNNKLASHLRDRPRAVLSQPPPYISRNLSESLRVIYNDCLIWLIVMMLAPSGGLLRHDELELDQKHSQASYYRAVRTSV
ncbi:hypothetical protein BC629DRAFT_1499891 [Irpex lacteus]|nr:hypothetical protein BC629DRAFT_1499891 [Irpex lacteus]